MKERAELITSFNECEDNFEKNNNETDAKNAATEIRTTCKFCKQKVSRVYRLKKHENGCLFKVPRNLLSSGVKVCRVRLIEKCENLASKSKLLSIEDSYEYNSLASLCVPGVFPLVFPGSSHFGSKVPPIIKKLLIMKVIIF